MVTRPLNSSDYTVGWICTLSIELLAAISMLDRRHPRLPGKPNDDNVYNLGSIGKHNIVIACLPMGMVGANHTIVATTQMALSFPSIKFGVMIGIGGGVPPNVRLGDIVVGIPSNEYPAVIKWDLGREEKDDKFIRTGLPKNPSDLLVSAVSRLALEQNFTGGKTLEYVDAMMSKHPLYARPGSDEDVLFKQNYDHVDKGDNTLPGSCDADLNKDENGEEEDEEEEEEEEKSCRLCDRSQTVKRKPRDMCVHYGLMASTDEVVKNATLRAKICRELGDKVLCFEMEAAGLVDKFPWLVVRGICNYADSHKNDIWNKHAAALAAAYVKELLEYI